jgi:prepilin-type N-terminal cleavage/methylation domain-containing protein
MYRCAVTRQSGLTLVEMMVAITVMLVGVFGTASLVNGANMRSGATRAHDGGAELAAQLIDTSRALPSHQLADNGIAAILQGQPGLEDQSSQPGWSIRRGNVTYSVTVDSCAYDDAADGAGVHSSSQFCADAPAGTADSDPDDYTRISVVVSWEGGGRNRQVKQATLVAGPATNGPPIASLALSSPSSTPITTAPATASFAATTGRTAATVRWAIDGVHAGSGSGSGTSWTFSWNIASQPDGTYLVAAEALDASGIVGGGRSLTITLNRLVPGSPTGFYGGRNGDAAEFEWIARPDRDLIGYRVYRLSSTGVSTLACSVGLETSCRDDHPPATSTIDYYVVAVDRAPSGAEREGARSATQTVTSTNSPPNAPLALTASTVSIGTALSWSAAAIDDPDPSDRVGFYRLYRDGVAYGDRYDRTGSGDELTITDDATGGVPHTYRVTAVDTQLAESPFAGPVTK